LYCGANEKITRWRTSNDKNQTSVIASRVEGVVMRVPLHFRYSHRNHKNNESE
jgi:hypothetical protein